jgi:hypothetical protein
LTAFDRTACGTITGAVTWVGPLPEIIQLSHSVPHPDGKGYDTRAVRLANAPNIDWVTRGVGGAVVFLRGVDPTRARPWDLPSVSVEFRNSQIEVIQERPGRTGFVRKGAEVEMRSTEREFQALRGRGAAFFAIAFPDKDKPVTRTFDTCGRVELTSAAGYYWQAADLFVCDHPYYALTTTPDGGFCFEQVPAGTYDLVVWHPSWIVTRADRNPESGVLNRLYYSPPLELSRSVAVSPNRTTLANLTLPR